MKFRAECLLPSYLAGLFVLVFGIWLATTFAAVSPTVQRLANGDVRIEHSTQAAQFYRIDASPDLQAWEPMVTLLSPGLLQHVDSAAGYSSKKFYRISQLTGTNILTGDHLVTNS